jgi:hypothetical protein
MIILIKYIVTLKSNYYSNYFIYLLLKNLFDIFRNPQRTELINHISVILWDELFSNDKHCFNAVYNSYNKFEGKVVIVIGDEAQIGPVVINGKRADTARASIINHILWKKFKVFNFTKNLRLLGIKNALDMNILENKEFYARQLQYN